MKEKSEKSVTTGNTAVVNYTGRLENGQVFDSSEGREPFRFTIGSNQVIPAFESCVMGKPIGFKTTVKIKSVDAYGPVREDLIVNVPIDKIPAEAQVGQILHANSQGQEIAVLVKEKNEDHAVIDGNHPLAGKDLEFDIEILDIIQ
jgi:FKBP-type peptidyl-prolyl cis-trans isomerase 2